MKMRKGPFTIIPNQIFERNQLSLQARFLFCVLLKYCGQDDHCYPSQKTLGKHLGMSDRHVRTIIKELIGSGLIVATRRGFNRSNTYYVAKELDWEKRKSGSYHLGSKYPLQQGNVLPNKNTYLKGKGKTSHKGLEKLGDVLIRKGIRPRSYTERRNENED